METEEEVLREKKDEDKHLCSKNKQMGEALSLRREIQQDEYKEKVEKGEESVDKQTREVVFLCLQVLIGSRGPCVTGAFYLTVTLQAFPVPPLTGLTITSQFHLQLLSPSLPFVHVRVCVHIVSLSCGPGETPNGKRFYHYVWLAISLHISSTLADRASCSITLLLFGPNVHRHMHIHTQKHSCSHTVQRCQSGQMSHP